MNLITLIMQIILTIPLTIILNYFQNKENRSFNQILIPTVYIIIIAALVPFIKENIFLIVVFEVFIRNFYITNITNRNPEVNNLTFIIENLISIALSLFTYNYFISQVDQVIPAPEDIKPFIWFLIIIYIISLYKLSSKEKVKKDKVQKFNHKKEHIIMQYAKFKNIYANIIKNKNDFINDVVYALIIYNEYKTPKIYRQVKAYIGAVTKKETEHGIMQIKSFKRLSDEQTIKIVIKDLEKQLKNIQGKEHIKIEKLLKNYKQEDIKEITNIYNIIVEFNNK